VYDTNVDTVFHIHRIRYTRLTIIILYYIPTVGTNVLYNIQHKHILCITYTRTYCHYYNVFEGTHILLSYTSVRYTTRVACRKSDSSTTTEQLRSSKQKNTTGERKINFTRSRLLKKYHIRK